MSVFKNIKGTIQSVQQDISTSIKSLTTSSKEKEVVTRQRRSHGVNLDAGADLLHWYQDNWSDLHHQAEENATKAEDLAVLIGSLYVKYSRQSENLTQMKEEGSTLPTILQQLQDLTNQIAKVEELCEQVEAAEVQLENICEVEEFNKAQTTHRHQLAAYRENKQRDVENFKVSLAQQHAKNIKSRDMKRQAQLKERQSIFQEAFDKDINYYRTFGHTERQPSVEHETAEMKLAEIKIEEDTSGLDSFLESTDVTPSSDRPPVLSQDEMPEDESDSGVINDRSESPDDLLPGHPSSEDVPKRDDVTSHGKAGESPDQPETEQLDKTSEDSSARENPGLFSKDDNGADKTKINGVHNDALSREESVPNDTVSCGESVPNESESPRESVPNKSESHGESVPNGSESPGESVPNENESTSPVNLAEELVMADSPSGKEEPHNSGNGGT